MKDIAEPVAGVDHVMTLDRARLVALWREMHAEIPPPSISQPLMRRILAFELQLKAQGGWPPGLRQRIARGREHAPRVRAAVPKPGGRLLREWNGTTHVVEIEAASYRWNGRTWGSLSAIAREITGAHWSGPRFFGLKPGDPRARPRWSAKG
jgi:hypothetical protein